MKKIISFTMAAVLILALLLSGCGSSNDDSNKDVDDGKTNGSSDNEKKDELYTEVGTFPIVNKKIELDIFMPGSSEIIDIETNEFTKYMEEFSNIHINWDLAPSDGAIQKLNLVLASGDHPDAYYGFSMSPDIISNYGVEQGVFEPLNDLIDKYTVNFKKWLKELPIRGPITATDGNIYALCTWNDCYHCSFSVKYWINSYWLDKLGLDMPKTTEDFYNVLKAFKEDDPNGNGLKDEVPLSGAANSWHTQLEHFLMNSFIYSPGMDEKTQVIVEDDVVKTIANQDGYREGLRYIKKLYDEGLIYSESFIQPVDQLRQLATNQDAEILGAYAAGHIGIALEAANSPERYRHYEALAPLEGPDGTRYATHFKYFAVKPGNFVISSDSKYKQAAIRWADYQYSFEGNRRKRGWRPGIEYTTDVEEGKKGIDGRPALWELLVPFSNEPQNTGYTSSGITMRPQEWWFTRAMEEGIDEYSPKGLELLLYNATADKYEPYAPEDSLSVKPIINLLPVEAEEIQVITVELEKYIEESRMKFIMDEWDLDKDWDNYTKGLDDIGLETYLEIMQRGYDRQYK